MLALALIHVASLCDPLGGGCSCPPLVGDGGGCSPPFVPLVLFSPLWPRCVAPLLHVVVVVSVDRVLLDVYGTGGLTID